MFLPIWLLPMSITNCIQKTDILTAENGSGQNEYECDGKTKQFCANKANINIWVQAKSRIVFSRNYLLCVLCPLKMFVTLTMAWCITLDCVCINLLWGVFLCACAESFFCSLFICALFRTSSSIVRQRFCQFRRLCGLVWSQYVSLYLWLYLKIDSFIVGYICFVMNFPFCLFGYIICKILWMYANQRPPSSITPQMHNYLLYWNACSYTYTPYLRAALAFENATANYIINEHTVNINVGVLCQLWITC